MVDGETFEEFRRWTERNERRSIGEEFAELRRICAEEGLGAPARGPRGPPRGQTRTQADMLMVATAKVHGLTLVTRNVRHFDACGVPVLNPFS